MNPESQYRYPGLEPFRTEQQAQFFGRSADLLRLQELVQTHQQVLLYAKSGYGKSSLINAGLVPSLNNCNMNVIIPIRIGTYLNATSPTPIKAIHSAFQAARACFLDRIISSEGSLWYHFKAITLHDPSPRVYYLLFDQFEEIFSHPYEAIFAFKKQMSDLLYRVVPQHFKSVLEIRRRENPDVLSQDEWEQLFQPMDIKVLYAIREDKYSELNRLADYLPDLLHYRYQLGPLSRAQAQEAIVRPAELRGDFFSASFQYTAAAVQCILDYLVGESGDHVETTQLQILCSHIERLRKVMINVDDIPEFDDIFLQFYEESMACLEDEAQKRARAFIETKMIILGQRIAYHRLACLEHIPAFALDTLLRERHLFRTERSSTGGISYELSHDTLVAPILVARERREMQEEKKMKEREAQALKEDLVRTRLARTVARKQLRKTRLALLLAVIGITVAIYACILALDWGREAHAQEAAKQMALDSVIAANHRAKLADEARIAAEADAIQLKNDRVANFVWRANYFHSCSNSALEARELDSAISLAPNRIDLIKRRAELDR